MESNPSTQIPYKPDDLGANVISLRFMFPLLQSKLIMLVMKVLKIFFRGLERVAELLP